MTSLWNWWTKPVRGGRPEAYSNTNWIAAMSGKFPTYDDNLLNFSYTTSQRFITPQVFFNCFSIHPINLRCMQHDKELFKKGKIKKTSWKPWPPQSPDLSAIGMNWTGRSSHSSQLVHHTCNNASGELELTYRVIFHIERVSQMCSAGRTVRGGDFD